MGVVDAIAELLYECDVINALIAKMARIVVKTERFTSIDRFDGTF